MNEMSRHLSFYVGLAVVFGVGVWSPPAAQSALEFFAGWLTEYRLSVDNLFIFIIIMSSSRCRGSTSRRR